MSGFNLKATIFSLFFLVILISTNFGTCHARGGKHWKLRSDGKSSSHKNKGNGKNHNHNHHGGGGGGGKKHIPKPKPHPSPSPMPDPSSSPTPSYPPSKGGDVFDVLNFGAKGDGKSDDTKAFEAAWEAACKMKASKVLVPAKYQYLVGPISFNGQNCQSNIVFQLDGTIVAPTSSASWGKGLLQWLEFTKLDGITIQGSGTVEGKGSVWWGNSMLDNQLNELINSSTRQMPHTRPTAVRFYGSNGVSVSGITIQNSPKCHLKFDNCDNVNVFDVSISAPGDSPNTDGIHLQNSQNVLIRGAQIGSGDDCVSIQTGCSNINIHHVKCGPGHGISIGGLGNDHTKACVSNVTVHDVDFQGTMTGVRIKTWQGGSGSVKNIRFSNIQVTEVKIPIVIDQFYCDASSCKNQTSAVALSDISYNTIKGTYTLKPVHLACSDTTPCMDIRLSDIDLQPVKTKYHLYGPFCWRTYGQLLSPTLPPIDCLLKGSPPKNHVSSASSDYC